MTILFLYFLSSCQMFFHLDEMYAEVCAYLTSYKYLELPNYRVSFSFGYLNNQ